MAPNNSELFYHANDGLFASKCKHISENILEITFTEQHNTHNMQKLDHVV